MRTIRIGILGYNGVAAMNLANSIHAFATASRIAESNGIDARYQTDLLSIDGNDISTDSGLVVHASEVDPAEFGTLIVPGGSALLEETNRNRLAEYVSLLAPKAKRIAALCTGAYALAATGLLNGRRVATHWAYARDLADRFPKLRVNPNAIFIRDDRFYTSAGGTAGLDLIIALIEEDLGDQIALAVARQLLVYRQRDGGQRQFAETPTIDTNRHGRMGQLVEWIQAHLEDDLSVTNLARQVCLSYNELVLQFREAFNSTPAAFVKALRMYESRRYLLCGDNVTAVAKRFRFRSLGYFVQEFTWRFGITPHAYRHRFSSVGWSTREGNNGNSLINEEPWSPATTSLLPDPSGELLVGCLATALRRKHASNTESDLALSA